jgi:hypothetical protein
VAYRVGYAGRNSQIKARFGTVGTEQPEATTEGTDPRAAKTNAPTIPRPKLEQESKDMDGASLRRAAPGSQIGHARS